MAITKGKLRKGTLGKGLATSQVTSGIPNNELPEVVLQATMENTMQDFVRFSTEKFQKAVWRLDVRQEGDLYESFKSRISSRSGNITGSIKFNFYGRFVDMGVGKGLTLIEKQTGRALTNSRNPSRITRKPKTWFTPIWTRDRERLSEVLARDVAKASGQNLADIMPSGTISVTI
jgi:hypothetical protein